MVLKISVLLCVFCGQNDSVQRIFIKKSVLFTVRSVCRLKRFITGSMIATEATAQRVEELIRADRRITMDSVGTALELSHGLGYSIMRDHLKFQKVCARSYGVQMEKICLTGLLLGTSHGYITTNPNQNLLHCNGTIPVHLQPKSLRL
jgi:hypothetical protein